MRRLPVLLLLSALAWPGVAAANDLRVSAATARARDRAVVVTAEVSWKNAWRNDRNHDAVWLFVKIRGRSTPSWQHARLVAASAAGPLPATCQVTTDGAGAFCGPSTTYRGDVTWQVSFEADGSRMRQQDLAAGDVEARVFAIEMVFVPAGPFSIGDLDVRSTEFAAFYRSDGSGNHAGLYRVESEAPIRIAPEAGALYYRPGTPQYGGDRQGPLPAGFPKGTRAFYTMKYEVSQGQYADFLNAISREYSPFRSPVGGLSYATERGTIRIDNGRYVAQSPDRPANWISWDDGLAFADWAGLRPMTELEFTKAARGPVEPVPGDFPWGTSDRSRLLRRVGPDDDLVHAGDADESRLSDETRDVLGASFYWVMDLAGSVWERVVTVGHPRGRAFRGTHGDGVLRAFGVATNDDWPGGDHDGGGFGYRGGGYYERGMADGDFNPFSPTAWRRFGSWGGAPRSIAYGFRAVRTVD